MLLHCLRDWFWIDVIGKPVSFLLDLALCGYTSIRWARFCARMAMGK